MEEKLFELMTKIYGEMQEMKSDIKKVEKKVDTLGNQFTSFENKVEEKLDALFDARLVGIDKDAEISTSVQRVEQKVDKLELRVIKSTYGKSQSK